MYDFPIEHLLDQRIFIAQSTARVAEVYALLAVGQTLVVLDQTDYPCGVLPEAQMGQLTDSSLSLEDYAELWLLPTVTNPGTLLLTIWKGMIIDQSSRWHVVCDQGDVLGVVGPDALWRTLFDLEQRPPASLPEPVRNLLLWFSAGPRLSDTGLPGNITINPLSRCFRCPGARTGIAGPHRLQPHEVVRHLPDTQPYCPRHPGQRLVVENPCRGDET